MTIAGNAQALAAPAEGRNATNHVTRLHSKLSIGSRHEAIRLGLAHLH
jgi:hypothetical protein